MADRRTRAPKVYWVVVDEDHTEFIADPFHQAFTSRQEAREHCGRLNGMKGYAPTCRVRKYVLDEAAHG